MSKQTAESGTARGKIKVGLVGLGRAGWGMHRGEIGEHSRLFTIVAACDPIKERREKLATETGCRTYRTIEPLIAAPAVELVDIASRSPEHVPHALAALKAGKHVLLEKPIALSYKEACLLKAAVNRSKGQLFIRHNRRFEPGFQHVREIIDSGLLGDVHTIKLCRNGFQRRQDWQTITACGGGQLLNWGPHLVDHALRLIDAPIKNLWSHLNLVAAAGDAEDHVRIILTGENERSVEIQISGGTALSEPVYTLHGTRGSLISEGNTFKLRYLSPSQKLKRLRPRKASPPLGTGFGGSEKLRWIEKTLPIKPRLKVNTSSIWKYLHKSLRRGEPFPITLEQSLAVMEIISKVKTGTRFDG